MIKIEPIRNRERLSGLFSSVGIAMPPFGFGMELTTGEGGGYALFEIDHDERSIGIIYASGSDIGLLDAAVRSGLAAGEQMGCVSFSLSPSLHKDMPAILTPLGYTDNTHLLGDFFSQCPSCRR